MHKLLHIDEAIGPASVSTSNLPNAEVVAEIVQAAWIRYRPLMDGKVVTGVAMYSLAIAGFVMLGVKPVQRFGSTAVFRTILTVFGARQVLMTFSPAARLMLAPQPFIAVPASRLHHKLEEIPELAAQRPADPAPAGEGT